MMIKKVLLGTLFLLLFTMGPLPLYAATELDSVIAVVNDNVITQSQLNALVFDMTQALQASRSAVPDKATLRKKALDQLIAESLQLQIASRNNITISDDQVNKAISNIAAQNNLSLDQLKQALTRQGIEYNKFRSQIKNQMIVRQIQSGLIAGKIQISDQEAKNYIKSHPIPPNPNAQYQIEDLLISFPESASKEEISQAKRKAEDVLKNARGGKSFENLADEEGNIKFINLGWRTTAQLPAVFSKPVSGMQKGDLSVPIQAPNGFHVLKIKDMRGEPPVMTVEDAKNIIFQEKASQQVDAWVNQLRRAAYIKIM